MKLRGLYLVTDRGVRPGSGAWHHVEIGIAELRRHFDIDVLMLSEPQSPALAGIRAHEGRRRVMQFVKEGGFAGAIRDARRYVRNNKDYNLIAKAIDTGGYSFIYERAAYLSDCGLRIAKNRNIKHFYEVNGIQYFERRNFYRSYAEVVASRLEARAYSGSDHVFFVGTWGDLINLSSHNWENIENGIEGWFIDSFHNHVKATEPVVRLCFIGQHMAHHRLDRLIQAIAYLKNPRNFEINLIGNGFDRLADELSCHIKVVRHGVLARVPLAQCLKTMHVGLVATETEFASQMKIFDYGAAKMLALVADTHNARTWFSSKELMLFEKSSPQSLASTLEAIENNRSLIREYGERLHCKIRQAYTWDKIFSHVSDVILRNIGKSA